MFTSASFGSISSDRTYDELPLETNMKRPTAFSAQSITASKQFLSDSVLYPKGLEHPSNFCIGRSPENTAVRAPYPCGSKLTASATAATSPTPDSSSPRSPGTPPPGGFSTPRNATSPTTNLLRQGLGAFNTANGIVHLDVRQAAHFQGGTLAQSLMEELRDHIASTAPATEPSQHAPEAPTGPHGSRRSRSMAVTLLLPTAIAGRQQANENNLSLLDALALIAQAPLSKRRAASVEQAVDEVARTWPSADTHTTTTSVRLSVVAGADDVTSYLSTLGIKTSGVEWLRSAGLCVSYVNSSRKIQHDLVQVTSSTQPTLEHSINAIQEAASALQVSTKFGLVLPHVFVSNGALAAAVADRASEPTSVFLDLQRDLQQRFYNLHLCEPFLELSKATIASLEFEGGHHFVRVVPRSAQFRDEDPSHAIGILLSSHEPTLDGYLRRCRAETPREPCSGTWPPYSLLDPENEEPSANISVLWFKPEVQTVGGDLSLFGPRSRIGAPVTELANSCINRLVPSLAPVQRLLAANYWVLPVTQRSVLPANGPYAQALYNSFAAFMKATIDRLAGIELPAPVYEEDEEAPRSTTLMEAETRSYLGHVLGLQVGHPATALGEIYSAMQLDAKHGRLASSAFHTLVTAGLHKYGDDCNVETLFQLCLEGMETDADGGEAAGASTNAAAAAAPPPPETDDLEHLLANVESRPTVLELAKLADEGRLNVALVANPDDDADLRWTNTRSILVAAWKVQKTGNLDEHMKANPKFRSRVEKKRAKLVSNPDETWTQVAGTLLACSFDENYDVFFYDGKRVLRRIDRSVTTMEAPTVYDLVPEVAVSKLLALKKKPCVLVFVEETGVVMIPPTKKKKRDRASVKVEEVVGGA